MKRIMIGALVLIQGLIALPAYARGDAESFAEIRQEIRTTSNNTIRVQGELACNLGSENNGQGCALQIRENGTGRVFQLSGNEDAMRLYQGGTRKVAIQGTLTGQNTLQITQTEAM